MLVYAVAGLSGWYVAPRATTRRFWTLRRVVRRDIGKDGLSTVETYLPELTIDLKKDMTSSEACQPW